MATIAAHVTADEAALAAIEVAATDYLMGYVTGDRERHLGAYHPEAIKRRYMQYEDGVFGMITLSPTTMADSAVTTDPEPDCQYEVFIDDVYQDMASVRVVSCNWVDYLHIVRARGEWRLLHVTWLPIDTS